MLWQQQPEKKKKKNLKGRRAKTRTASILFWRNGLIIKPHHYVGLTKHHREPRVVYAVWCSQNVGSLIFRSQTSCLGASLYAWIHSARPHCCCDIHKQAFVWLTRSSHFKQTRALCPLFRAPLSPLCICDKNGAPDYFQTHLKRDLCALWVLCLVFLCYIRVHIFPWL